MSQDAALKSIENSVADIRAWMLSDRLLINDSKTEFIIIGSKQQMSKININEIIVGESAFEPVEVVFIVSTHLMTSDNVFCGIN